MKMRGFGLVAIVVVLALLAIGVAVVLHMPHTQHVLEHLHGANPQAAPESGASETSAATERARAGVAALGQRWDAAAYAETVALYTAVHRELEWPGLLEPQTISYGPDAEQTFDLFLPEQGFSEPGPVFVFLHGNGLGSGQRNVPGSDGLIYSHVGKLAATFGGIGISMGYRNDPNPTLEDGAEDVRLVVRWIRDNIAPYGGDPDTIVLTGNSEGAVRAAAYLFNEAWQLPEGPGVAAAVLSSGQFASDQSGIEQLVFDYKGERVPLALWKAEYDPPEITSGVADLHELLCRKYDGCPWYETITGHNHVSHLMSFGTDDEYAMYALIRFYHTVR
jgi:acetyl esterase/lipase